MVGLSGSLVRLADVRGGVTVVPLVVPQAASDFEVLDGRRRRAVPAVASLEGLPESVMARPRGGRRTSLRCWRRSATAATYPQRT